MTSAQYESVQWGLTITVILLLPQLFLRKLTFGRFVWTGYLSMLFAVTFLPLGAGRSALQLVPFQWIADTMRDGPIAYQQMLLNVALFVPLGVLLTRNTHAVAIGFTLSLAIETGQLVFGHRIFDVDDLITNTTGTLIGWLVANWALHLIRAGLKDAKSTFASSEDPNVLFAPIS